MSASTIIGLLAALLVLQLLLWAGTIAIAGRFLHGSWPSFFNVMKVSVAIWGLNFLLALPVALLAGPGLGPMTGTSGVVLALAIAAFVLFLFKELVEREFSFSGAEAIGVVAISGLTTAAAMSVLVFLIKTYCCDAYVIPTGSMATNFLGKHGNVTCSNCGCKFDVSLSHRFDANGQVLPFPQMDHAQCKYCGLVSDIDGQIAAESGDRIIVDKVAAPKRWDAAVYRTPDKSTNYIKRLVGLSGEWLAIADGDIFANDVRQAKQPHEQLDLWFPVHDTQLVPKTIENDTPRWQPVENNTWIPAGSGWKIGSDNTAPATLAFHGTVDDRLSHNLKHDGRGFVEPAKIPVGDVQIVCHVDRFKGNGAWAIEWQFDNRSVQCRFHPSGEIDLACDTSKRADGNGVQRATGKLQRTGDTASQIALAIRDGFAYVLEDGRLCATLQIAPTRLAEIARTQKSESGRAAIHAAQCDLTISRIQLARDVYYQHPENHRMIVSEPYFQQLKPGEVFFLGDNSAQSKDSRYDGPSSSSDVIGVARLIYWPPNRWHSFE